MRHVPGARPRGGERARLLLLRAQSEMQDSATYICSSVTLIEHCMLWSSLAELNQRTAPAMTHGVCAGVSARGALLTRGRGEGGAPVQERARLLHCNGALETLGLRDSMCTRAPSGGGRHGGRARFFVAGAADDAGGVRYGRAACGARQHRADDGAKGVLRHVQPHRIHDGLGVRLRGSKPRGTHHSGKPQCHQVALAV